MRVSKFAMADADSVVKLNKYILSVAELACMSSLRLPPLGSTA